MIKPELLRPDEAAKRLKISQRQVYRLVESGRLLGVTLPGTKTVRVFAASVESYIKKGTHVTNS